jgi:epoxyqueuosine reductase
VDTPTNQMRASAAHSPVEKTRWITARARELGFELCGVAAAVPLDEHGKLPEWLASGYGGEMKYLHDARRADPAFVLPGAKSVIVAALNYNSPRPLSIDTSTGAMKPPAGADEAPRGWISRYAWGSDYHDLLLRKLEDLLAMMRAEFADPFEARAYVDTGPILERVAAKHAGLGWLAKNTLLINQRVGSWLFLGVILSTLDLAPSVAPSEALPRDLCGSCTRCLDACPTQAFPAPYVLDARRCISYLTIELRGAIPEELRAQMGAHVFGCDICQDVCPWNRRAPATALAAFLPREFPSAAAAAEDPTQPRRESRSLFAPELEWLAALTQEEFSALFRGSAVKRAKWRGLVRNACVALGNANFAPGSPARERVLSLLDRLASSDDAFIAEHARWSAARLRAGK